MAPTRIIIAPGIGAAADSAGNCFYSSLRSKLYKRFPNCEVVLRDFPDPYGAKESVWIPFMKEELQVGDNSILIGHSSGASAAMRFAERYPVAGLVLVAAATSDQGDETERLSEYFNRPWQYEAARRNAPRILQLGATDDSSVPITEQRTNAEGLQSDFIEFEKGGHFCQSEEPRLEETILDWLDKTF